MKIVDKVLNVLFRNITANEKVTWLSRKYFQWNDQKIKVRNQNYKRNHCNLDIFFEVHGAGDICISRSCHYSTGEVVGFDFGVEWGKFGFCGGVLGKEEAKRLANFILEKCEKD